MKIKSVYIPLYCLIGDLFLSLPQITTSIDIKVGSGSVLGLFRIFMIPILLLVAADATKRKVIRLSTVSLISLATLTSLFLLQTFAIPGSLVTHFSGSAKFIFWFLSYFVLITTVTPRDSLKVKNTITLSLVIVFLMALIQYPYLIAQGGVGLGQVFSSYGSFGKVKTYGLFLSANEDGNGMMTLFPFMLYKIEQLTGPKKTFLRGFILAVMPFVLLINGTRTALFITFPILVILFYSKFSPKQIIRLLLIGSILGLLISLVGQPFIDQAFSSESDDGGTFNWRIENLWIPAINYTSDESLLFGFGTRGWEHFCAQSPNPLLATQCYPSHNAFVWSFVAWGVLGFTAYVLYIFNLLFQSIQVSSFKKDPDIALLGKAVICSTVGYCLWSLISNSFMNAGWIIIFLLGSLLYVLKMIVYLSTHKNYLLRPQASAVLR